jgi:hypothetical protein
MIRPPLGVVWITGGRSTFAETGGAAGVVDAAAGGAAGAEGGAA